jgi:ATP-binding cassette subfamily B protein
MIDTAMIDKRLSSWRPAAHLARYRPGMLLLSFAFFVAASSSMLVIGWLLQQIFNAMSNGRPAGPGIYGIIAVLAAVELARIAASWAGVVRSLYWEQLRGLLRLNLLRAQMARGGSRAGALPASPGEAVSRFRDDVDDFLAFLEIAVFVAGELLFAVGSITIMMSIDPLITIAVVLPLVIVVFTTRMTDGQIRT